MLKALRLLMLGVFTVAVLLLGGLFAPYRGFGRETYVDIPKGTSTREIGALLARAQVIRYPWQLLLVRALRPRARLQAGEYRFVDSASVPRIFDRLARGDVFYYEITVPEGSNIFDIAGLVQESGLMTQTGFLNAAAQARLVADLDPSAPTLEGYLFPSTYRITRRTTPDQLVRQMLDQFRKEWKQLTAKAGSANVHDIVTLASLVEKETGVAAERPRVASVYANRLRIGMKLDCDPTTIYAALLEDRYRGKIHRSDLAGTNSYNTYQHAGLPPGPIANPGRASLEAALKPEQTPFLYFVAKPGGSGSHQFSAEYSEHQKAVQAYRHAQSKAGSAR